MQPAKANLLFVEDHLDTLLALGLILERDGYCVFRASTIAEARDVAAAGPIDLILCDIGLPDGDGCELFVELAARYGMKGIAFSGYGQRQDVSRYIAAGFADHLIKPCDVATLLRCIERVLQVVRV